MSHHCWHHPIASLIDPRSATSFCGTVYLMAPEQLVGHTSAIPDDSINNASDPIIDTCSAATAAAASGNSASIPDSTTVTESGVGGATAASDWWGVGAFLFELLFGCVNSLHADYISLFEADVE